MDPDVTQDPVFQQLLLKYELESRKLRDAVIAMRSFYLKHHKSPGEESATEQWRSALLAEESCLRHLSAKAAASDLLRYAFELAPTHDDALHLEELLKLKLAHEERTNRRTGWGKTAKPAAGIEEKVYIDGGHPVTWVIKPKNYEFTERARSKQIPKEPATDPGEGEIPTDPHPGDDETKL